MGDFRIKYGLALGPFGTYGPRSDLTVFPESATTPDVTTGSLFYTQNTTNTAITHFNVLGAGGQPGSAADGKLLVVYYKDGSTSVVSAGQMFLLNTSSVAYPAGTVATYLYHNSAWTELTRSYPTQSPFITPAVTAVAGSFSVDVTTANVVLLTPSAAGAVLVSLSGGQMGQSVYIVPGGSSQTLFFTGAGNLFIGNTGAFLTTTLGTYEFIRVAANTWRLVKGGISN